MDHLSRSAKLEDIIKAEKEITRVRGQIEQLEGRLRYLDNRVSFSSIHITLQDKLGPEAIIPPKSYSIAHEFSSAIQSLVGFGQGLLTRGIWAGVWSLVWLPLALLGFWITRRVYKMSKTG